MLDLARAGSRGRVIRVELVADILFFDPAESLARFQERGSRVGGVHGVK